MKQFILALCILTVSIFGVLGCTKTDDAGAGGGTTETAEEAPAEEAAE